MVTSSSGERHRRIDRGTAIVTVVGAVLAALLLAAPALASLTGGCTATAVIDGVRYGPGNDTAANPIEVPDRSDVVAQWEASAPFDQTNNRGHVDVVIGPGSVTVAEWGPGGGGSNSSSGTYSRQELQNQLPGGVKLRGIYELTGVHESDGGRCEGRALLRFGGNPLDSPIGIVSVAGLGLSGVGLAGAAVTKRS